MKKLLAMLAIAMQLTAAGLVYPTTMQVVNLDYGADLVTVQTATGFQYEFEGTEDYTEGDLVSLVMWSGGTKDITDDMILAARYSGYWIE